MLLIKSMFKQLLVTALFVPILSWSIAPEDRIAATNNSILYLDDNGHVWTWGESDRGSLGLGEVASFIQKTPVRLPLDNIIAVRANSTVAYALDKDGIVWVWGDYSYSGIQNPGDTSKIRRPKRYEGVPPIKKIFAHEKTTIALSANNQTLAWGSVPGCNPLSARSSSLKPTTYRNKIENVLYGSKHGFLGLVDSSQRILTCEKPPFKVLPGVVQLGPVFKYMQYMRIDNGHWYRVDKSEVERLSGIGDIQSIALNHNLLLMLRSDGQYLIWNDTDKDIAFTSKIIIPARQTRLFAAPEPIVHQIWDERWGVIALGESGKVYMHSSSSMAINRLLGPRGFYPPPEFFSIFDPRQIQGKKLN